MKRIEAIIPNEKISAVSEAFKKAGIGGCTILEAKGRGKGNKNGNCNHRHDDDRNWDDRNVRTYPQQYPQYPNYPQQYPNNTPQNGGKRPSRTSNPNL